MEKRKSGKAEKRKSGKAENAIHRRLLGTLNHREAAKMAKCAKRCLFP